MRLGSGTIENMGRNVKGCCLVVEYVSETQPPDWVLSIEKSSSPAKQALSLDRNKVGKPSRERGIPPSAPYHLLKHPERIFYSGEKKSKRVSK